MKNTKRLFIATGVALATSLTFATSAMAAQHVMKVATWAPAMHLQNSIVFKNYKEMVEKATDNRVTIKLEYGLGAPPAMFDLVEDGVADAAWTYNGYIPGRFDMYRFMELPLGKPVDVRKASVAMYKTLEKFYKNSNGDFKGYEGLHLVGTFFHPAMQIVTKKRYTKMSELKGLKMVPGSQTRGDMLEYFGMVPIMVPAPKIYENAQQGVVDGTTMPYEAQETFRLKEVTPYIMHVDINIGHFAMVLSKDFLAKLSDKDRKAITALSGEKFSRMAGDGWQSFEDNVKNNFDKSKVVKSDALSAEFNKWVSSYNSKKLAEYAKQDPKVKDAYNYYMSLIK